jgi:radical SAM-linked protein
MRARITFAKTEAMRFTGHLDLHRTWERTIRRSGLPLAYSQGFKPHPRIVLASALPLGCTSQDELVDIWLEESRPLDEIEASLSLSAPPGLQILSVCEAELHEPALPVQVTASEYEVTFLTPLPDLDQRADGLLMTQSLPRIRREKTYDLRPLILEIHRLPDDPGGCQKIALTLAARENATGRPEEVVRALGSEPEATNIHRTKLILSTQASSPL